MLHQQTIDQLHEMKLHGFLQALDEQDKDTDIQSLSFEDRLALLVEREYPPLPGVEWFSLEA